MWFNGGLRGGRLVLPRRTPLGPRNLRYLVTGTRGGHTIGSGGCARADAQICFTKRGTSRVSRGGEEDVTSARPATDDAATTSIEPATQTAARPARPARVIRPRLAKGGLDSSPLTTARVLKNIPHTGASDSRGLDLSLEPHERSGVMRSWLERWLSSEPLQWHLSLPPPSPRPLPGTSS